MSGPRKRRRDPETPLHTPKAKLAHVADEYAALGGMHTGEGSCRCGPCVAAWLRRPLHPRIVVANGATATPYRKREDS